MQNKFMQNKFMQNKIMQNKIIQNKIMQNKIIQNKIRKIKKKLKKIKFIIKLIIKKKINKILVYLNKYKQKLILILLNLNKYEKILCLILLLLLLYLFFTNIYYDYIYEPNMEDINKVPLDSKDIESLEKKKHVDKILFYIYKYRDMIAWSIYYLITCTILIICLGNLFNLDFDALINTNKNIIQNIKLITHSFIYPIINNYPIVTQHPHFINQDVVSIINSFIYPDINSDIKPIINPFIDLINNPFVNNVISSNPNINFDINIKSVVDSIINSK